MSGKISRVTPEIAEYQQRFPRLDRPAVLCRGAAGHSSRAPPRRRAEKFAAGRAASATPTSPGAWLACASPGGAPAATGSPPPAKRKDGLPHGEQPGRQRRRRRHAHLRRFLASMRRAASITPGASPPLPNGGGRRRWAGREPGRRVHAWLRGYGAVSVLAGRVLLRRSRRGSHRPCGAAAWRAGAVPVGASAPGRPACRWCPASRMRSDAALPAGVSLMSWARRSSGSGARSA